MKPLPKLLLALTAVAAVSFAYPASVQAVPITYQYTGNPFTQVSGPYTMSMFVTAMVTLAGPLAPNMPLTQVVPTAFTISDGVQTITNLNATAFAFFFGTDSTGAITSWFVSAINFGAGIQTSNFQGAVDKGFFGDDQGVRVGAPGGWTV